MKGLTNEQLKTVLENTIKRVMEENKVTEEAYDATYKRDEEPMEESNCGSAKRDDEIVEEEIVEEKIKNPGKYKTGMEAGYDDDGDGVPNGADPDPKDGAKNESLRESFTSKKDQLLFERLANKWTK
tara:strand:- start:404 stop:784 length:381 start_codon:yes stop_codon:yes gene_type:complete